MNWRGKKLSNWYIWHFYLIICYVSLIEKSDSFNDSNDLATSLARLMWENMLNLSFIELNCVSSLIYKPFLASSAALWDAVSVSVSNFHFTPGHKKFSICSKTRYKVTLCFNRCNFLFRSLMIVIQLGIVRFRYRAIFNEEQNKKIIDMRNDLVLRLLVGGLPARIDGFPDYIVNWIYLWPFYMVFHNLPKFLNSNSPDLI